MAMFGSNWLEDDESEISIFSHWLEDEETNDDFEPLIKHFEDNEDNKEIDDFESLIKHFKD